MYLFSLSFYFWIELYYVTHALASIVLRLWAFTTIPSSEAYILIINDSSLRLIKEK